MPKPNITKKEIMDLMAEHIDGFIAQGHIYSPWTTNESLYGAAADAILEKV